MKVHVKGGRKRDVVVLEDIRSPMRNVVSIGRIGKRLLPCRAEVLIMRNYSAVRDWWRVLC